jgi:hypothetical protein
LLFTLKSRQININHKPRVTVAIFGVCRINHKTRIKNIFY